MVLLVIFAIFATFAQWNFLRFFFRRRRFVFSMAGHVA
jgi:hypothetical protein